MRLSSHGNRNRGDAVGASAGLGLGEADVLVEGVVDGPVGGDKSDCHFRGKATEYETKIGMKWLSCTAK